MTSEPPPSDRPSLLDPLRDEYRASVAESEAQLEQLHRGNIALLCIDLQFLDAARGVGVFDPTRHPSMPQRAEDYYFGSLEQTVLPNVARLQRAFRERSLEVIHTRIQSLTPDGRDRSPAHKRLGLHAPPGSKEAEFIPEVSPLPHEIVINKTASGVFSSTNIEYVLHNLGVRGLFVTGVYTNECVSSAVRSASDLGFHVTLVQDATTTVTADLQASSIRVLRDRYARIMRADGVVRELTRICGQ